MTPLECSLTPLTCLAQNGMPDFPPKTCSPAVLPVWVEGNSVLPVAQTKLLSQLRVESSESFCCFCLQNLTTSFLHKCYTTTWARVLSSLASLCFLTLSSFFLKFLQITLAINPNGNNPYPKIMYSIFQFCFQREKMVFKESWKSWDKKNLSCLKN